MQVLGTFKEDPGITQAVPLVTSSAHLSVLPGQLGQCGDAGPRQPRQLAQNGRHGHICCSAATSGAPLPPDSLVVAERFLLEDGGAIRRAAAQRGARPPKVREEDGNRSREPSAGATQQTHLLAATMG